MIDPELAEQGTRLEIEILGKMHPALVIADSPFDGGNKRLKDIEGANE